MCGLITWLGCGCMEACMSHCRRQLRLTAHVGLSVHRRLDGCVRTLICGGDGRHHALPLDEICEASFYSITVQTWIKPRHLRDNSSLLYQCAAVIAAVSLVWSLCNQVTLIDNYPCEHSATNSEILSPSFWIYGHERKYRRTDWRTAAFSNSEMKTLSMALKCIAQPTLYPRPLTCRSLSDKGPQLYSAFTSLPDKCHNKILALRQQNSMLK